MALSQLLAKSQPAWLHTQDSSVKVHAASESPGLDDRRVHRALFSVNELSREPSLGSNYNAESMPSSGLAEQ